MKNSSWISMATVLVAGPMVLAACVIEEVGPGAATGAGGVVGNGGSGGAIEAGGSGGTGAAGGSGGTGAAGGSGGSGGASSDLPSCTAPLFVDAIPAAAWVNLDVSSAGGTAAIRAAILAARDEHPNEPVRVRLAPGVYADNLGGELYVQRALRTAANPIWVVATDPTPNATVLGHGLNFVGVSYVALEGLTIGPAKVGAWTGSSHANPQPLQAQAGIHVAGAAINGGKSAIKSGGALDVEVYGRYEPSHHIVVRNVTIQNLFDPGAQDAVRDEGQSMDGIKFNQAQDVWVLGSTIRQTSRHGVDNVGVHRAAFCGNTIADSGGGLGIEAKGGSAYVLYEANVFHNVRRVELGGEDTDATYYYSIDGLYTYEAKRVVARNNLIVDPREAALEFSGCSDCSAVHNSVLYTTAYVVPGLAQGNVTGGDALRIHNSVLLDAANGAGNDCVSWDAAQNDYIYFETCWGVGSNAPAPVGSTLETSDVRAENNAFLSPEGIWSGTDPTIPCPLNLSGDTPSTALTLDGNYWWNGALALPDADHGCPVLAEGSHSVYSTASATADPKLGASVVDAASMSALRASAIEALTPAESSPLLGAAVAGASDAAAYDLLGVARPASSAIGALE